MLPFYCYIVGIFLFINNEPPAINYYGGGVGFGGFNSDSIIAPVFLFGKVFGALTTEGFVGPS
jgi:hypothetical protein